MGNPGVEQFKKPITVSDQDILDRLHSVFDRETPETLIRYLAQVVAEKINEFLYLAHERGDDQLFIDFSEGDFLDRHAAFYGIRRFSGETDAALRIRIDNAINARKVTKQNIINAVAQYTEIPPAMCEFLDQSTWFLGVSYLGATTRLWDMDELLPWRDFWFQRWSYIGYNAWLHDEHRIPGQNRHAFVFWLEVTPPPIDHACYLGYSYIGYDAWLFGTVFNYINPLIARIVDEYKAAGVTAYIQIQIFNNPPI